MSRLAPFIVLLVLSVLCAVALLQPDAEDTRLATLPPLDMKALGDDAASLSTRGEVTLINFFASWCGPCRLENAELARLQTEEGLAIHGVAWNDKPKALRLWLADHGNPYDHVWLDDKGRAAIAMGIKGVPETFIVDKKGDVRYHLTGVVTAEERETKIVPLVRKLVAE